MTERDAEEIDDFWMREAEKIENAHTAALKAKDDEIARLQEDIATHLEHLRAAHQYIAAMERDEEEKYIEIDRLRTALEKIGDPRMYFHAEHGETDQWMGWGGKTPADFARRALGGET